MVISLPHITETTREPSRRGQEINSPAGSCLEGSRRLWADTVPARASPQMALLLCTREEGVAGCVPHRDRDTVPAVHVPALSLLALSRCLGPGGDRERRTPGPAGLRSPHLYNGVTAAPSRAVGPGQEKPSHNTRQVAKQQAMAGDPLRTFFWETAGSHRAHGPRVLQAKWSVIAPLRLWVFESCWPFPPGSHREPSSTLNCRGG